LYSSPPLRSLPSFPTRRSSDLQNHAFVDRYLEIPYDLSHTLFVCTANVLDNIPSPLRDRMEVIRLSGYTESEKLQIAKRHLIPEDRKSTRLNSSHVSISYAVFC